MNKEPANDTMFAYSVYLPDPCDNRTAASAMSWVSFNSLEIRVDFDFSIEPVEPHRMLFRFISKEIATEFALSVL